jgi:hypothetical protein
VSEEKNKHSLSVFNNSRVLPHPTCTAQPSSVNTRNREYEEGEDHRWNIHDKTRHNREEYRGMVATGHVHFLW